MATRKIEFSEILSEASNVFYYSSPHFLALSALFTSPFVFSLLTFPVLQHLQITNIHIPQDGLTLTPVIFFLFFAFILLTLYICATATITYSSYHVIFGQPVKFVDGIKSFPKSLIQLFATFFCALLIILAGLIGLGFTVFGIIKGFECLGFQIEYSSKYFLALEATLGYGLLYICVNWCLAPVIVVVESSWGLEPLRRSAYLVKGCRCVVLCLMLYFGFIICIPVFGTWLLASVGGAWVVVAPLVNSAELTLCLLNSLTTNNVLYMKCKALHGEIAKEIVEEFAQPEYTKFMNFSDNHFSDVFSGNFRPSPTPVGEWVATLSSSTISGCAHLPKTIPF